MNARIAQAVPCGSTPLYTTANWPAQTRLIQRIAFDPASLQPRVAKRQPRLLDHRAKEARGQGMGVILRAILENSNSSHSR